MAERMRLAGRTAIVTGAASGIGRAVAASLARRGCHLALADVMRERIAGCRVELIEGGHMIPLTAPDRVAAFVRAVDREATIPTGSSLAAAS
ncbi:MAG TPA: SDR family NAD(P)-dependent oxidoreductase [Longimicrobium sp.]|nr:SDR family NAD(P)-dependent oxidoreductase [Longimicrobium sp.]